MVLRDKIFPKILISFLVLFMSCNSSDEVKIRTGSIEEALKVASQSKKNLVVIVTYPGCPTCDILLSSATKKNEFTEVLSHFVVYDFNVLNPANSWVEQWMFEKAYPIACVFSPEGKLITLIENGDINKIEKVLTKIAANEQDKSIYDYSKTRLTVKGKELVETLNASFQGYRVLNQNKATNEAINKAILNVKTSVAKESYFFNNYVLSKLYYKIKDTTSAAKYTQTALNFSSTMDAVLYPPLRAELKYQLNNKYDQYDDAYLAIKQTTRDIGKIERSKKPVISFQVKNVGKKPLLIKEVVVSCSCTAAQWPKKNIMPGEEANIDLTYKPGKEGVFQQTAYIISNAFNSSVTITINGYVQ